MSVKLLRHDNSAEQFKGKIKLSIDKIAYTSKPAGAEIGAIRNRLGSKAAAAKIDIPTLGNVINNGQTTQGSILRDKQSDNEDTDSRFLEQQLFFIDIDNDYKDKESGKKYKSPAALDTPEQILAIATGAGLHPCIIAESFSSGKKDPNGEPIHKFHVGFAAAETITEVKQARRILFKLIDVFKGAADEACKDPARIIFGTAQSKQVYYNSAVNSIEALLNCSKAEPEETLEDPQQQPLPSSEPADTAPRKSKGTNSAPKASGKTGIMSDFTRDLKENKTDPDRLLFMIDPNTLDDYSQWFRALSSYKLFDGATIENFDTWNRQYTGANANYKGDLKTYKGAKGKGIDKMSLHAIAEEKNPEEYNNYMQELISIHKHTAPKTKSSKSNSAAGTISQQPAPSAAPAEQVEQWNDIKPFEKTIDLQPFPLETLPKVLQDYVKAAAAYNSVYPEICILPMFAALSVCLQGKANVIYPGNGHTETLSLYCITIAAPGERKTSTNKLFMKPIKDYEQWYNTIHDSEIKEYNIKHKILENRLNKAIQKAGTTKDNNANEREALQLRADLTELEKGQKHPLNFTLQDVTPEALIDTLNENQERAAIVGDEATLFKILGGAYSGGKGSSGVNFDILLTSYDGEQYKVSRKGSGNIYLKAPIITIGTMIQEQQFMQILENKDFVGKGFLQRFIFSKPRSNVGNIPFYSPKIPSKTAGAYKELIYSLLEKKQLPKPAELTFDKEAVHFIEYYHTEVQKKIRPGGAFSDPLLQEYASKQVAKVMKIAALLHLCEHSEGEPISGHTAMNAVKIGAWLETQAIAALNGEMQTDNERNARHIMKNLIKHIKSQKAKGEQVKELSKSELLRLCRTIKADPADEALAYLEDINAIRLTEIKTNGHPKIMILLNPAITDFKF